MAWRFALAALIGGICYLDRTAAFQLMLHRPLVVATAMGAVFGNFAAGAQVGVVLELLYLARLPVGAVIPPDDTGAAAFAGAAAAASSSSIGLDAGTVTGILLLSVPCAEIGKYADRFVRRVNGRIAHIIVDSVEAGDVRALENGLYAGLTLFLLAGVVLTVAFSGLGLCASKMLLPHFGPESRHRFLVLFPAVALLGAASVFSCSRTERTAPVFYLTMAAVFAALALFR